jgi:hypothetical protein
MTPPAPSLDAFDRAVNALCGDVGSKVYARDFQAMMRAHPGVLNTVYTFTEGKVFGDERPASSLEAYLDRLTDAWFSSHGFAHIYCGELNWNTIGGLHFRGRLLDLQLRQLGGRLPHNTSQEEAQPGAIYAVGIELDVGERVVQVNKKSYGLTLSAADILKAGTKALSANPTRSPRNEACLLAWYLCAGLKAFARCFRMPRHRLQTRLAEAW